MRRVSKEKYPWDECIKDQMDQYGDMEIAEKVCGAIKAKSQGKSAERVASLYMSASRMKNLMLDMYDDDEAFDYTHDTSTDRRLKALKFLEALYRFGNLGKDENLVVSAMNALTYSLPNADPKDAIVDSVRKKVRHLAYKNERKVTSKLPALPRGVVFKDEIRRLFGD